MTIKLKCLFGLVSLALICGKTASAQSSLTPITYAKGSGDAFTFTKKWAYPWYIQKDDKGKFIKAEDGEITKKDTAHLYYTANCKTNVQGGYQIRYCRASNKGNAIKLNFADGLPGYGSEFNIYLSKGKFYFEPVIVYPAFTRGEKITHKVTSSRLTLYQPATNAVKVISGFVDVEFIETSTGTKFGTTNHKYYFRGYFKSPVKS
jgi:hypothetical protein